MSKSLEKYQALSIFTKIITLAVGIVQSVIIIRILSVQEYGLIGLVLSIGAFIGIYQHLGLQEGIIREISASKETKESAKVIFASLFARLVITLPLAVLLFIFAEAISTKFYHQPEITAVLRFFSLILILQGIEGVFGAALSGLQKFKALFLSQIVSSIIALGLLVALTYFMRVAGFFYAMALASVVMILILVFLVLKYLQENVNLPSKQEFKQILSRVFSISLIVYLARILFTFWQRMGILFLGFFVAAYELGLFSLALAFGTKLVILSHAVSEVNLAIMTKKFTENYDDFLATFKNNFIKIFSFVLFLSLSVIFFSPEIIVYIVGDKYLPALKIIPIIMVSFLLYTVIDLVANSLFVPARKQKYRLYTFLVTVIISGIFIYILVGNISKESLSALFNTSLALFIGISAGLIYLILSSIKNFNTAIFGKKEILVILVFLPIILASFFEIGLLLKVIIYLLNTGLFVYIIQKWGIVNFKNLKSLLLNE